MTQVKEKAEIRPANSLDSLKDLLDYFEITEWDAIIAADGSGSRWNQPTGYAAVLIDRVLDRRKFFVGGHNTGTNQTAELDPFVVAMDWYSHESGPGAARLKQLRELGDPRDLLIHCVSDAEVLVKQGRGEYRTSGPHYWRWTALNQIEALGYRYKFHWLPRSLCGLNRLCDNESRRTRIAFQDIGSLIDVGLGLGTKAIEDIQANHPNVYDDGWEKPRTREIKQKTKAKRVT